MIQLPCMTEEELNILKIYIEEYKPKRCLEWGIGWSTVHLSTYNFIEEWIGIEPHQDWINRIREHVTDKVKLYHCPDTDEPFENKVDNYVKNKAIKEKYDFIFIDGAYRWQCLEHASNILSENGICFAHDTARRDMHPHFNHFKNYKVLTPGEFNSNNDWHQGLTILWNSISTKLIG